MKQLVLFSFWVFLGCVFFTGTTGIASANECNCELDFNFGRSCNTQSTPWPDPIAFDLLNPAQGVTSIADINNQFLTIYGGAVCANADSSVTAHWAGDIDTSNTTVATDQNCDSLSYEASGLGDRTHFYRVSCSLQGTGTQARQNAQQNFGTPTGSCECELTVNDDTSSNTCSYNTTFPISNGDNAKKSYVTNWIGTQITNCVDPATMSPQMRVNDLERIRNRGNGTYGNEKIVDDNACTSLCQDLNICGGQSGQRVSLTCTASAQLPTAPPILQEPASQVTIQNNYEGIPFALPSTADLRQTSARSIPMLIGQIVRFVTGLFGSIALLLVIYGGIRIMLAGGQGDKVKEGAKVIAWAGIGLVTMMLSYVLVSFVLGVF